MIVPSNPLTIGAAPLLDGLGVPLPVLLALDEPPEPEADFEALGGAVALAEPLGFEPEGVALALADSDTLASVVAEPEIESEAEGVAATAPVDSTKEGTGLPAAAQPC